MSRLSQTHNGHMFSRKPTGFNATLKCYMSKEHGGCGKAQEQPVFLTHSRTTLLACLGELRNRIEQKHEGKFFSSKNRAKYIFLKKQTFSLDSTVRARTWQVLDHQDRALRPRRSDGRLTMQVCVLLGFIDPRVRRLETRPPVALGSSPELYCVASSPGSVSCLLFESVVKHRTRTVTCFEIIFP